MVMITIANYHNETEKIVMSEMTVGQACEVLRDAGFEVATLEDGHAYGDKGNVRVGITPDPVFVSAPILYDMLTKEV